MRLAVVDKFFGRGRDLNFSLIDFERAESIFYLIVGDNGFAAAVEYLRKFSVDRVFFRTDTAVLVKLYVRDRTGKLEGHRVKVFLDKPLVLYSLLRFERMLSQRRSVIILEVATCGHSYRSCQNRKRTVLPFDNIVVIRQIIAVNRVVSVRVDYFYFKHVCFSAVFDVHNRRVISRDQLMPERVDKRVGATRRLIMLVAVVDERSVVGRDDYIARSDGKRAFIVFYIIVSRYVVAVRRKDLRGFVHDVFGSSRVRDRAFRFCDKFVTVHKPAFGGGVARRTTGVFERRAVVSFFVIVSLDRYRARGDFQRAE